MSKYFRLAAVVAAAWVLPCLAFAQGEPDTGSGKTFVVVSDTELTVTDSDLRVSVTSGPFEPNEPILQVVSQPSHGSLDPDGSEVEPAWKYSPDAGFFGRDSFEYQIGDQPFQAYFLVVPAKFPIAGRWPTAGCRRDKIGALDACPTRTTAGHGAELGWYDALRQSFMLCDWQGRVVTDCVELSLPAQGSSFQTWTPLVLDRDGDGWSELALRDPLSGLSKIFLIVPNGPGNQAASLTLVDEWWVGDAGDLPLAGSWLEGATSELGVYRYQDDVPGVFGHLLLESESDRIVNDLGNDIERAWPLAGDWFATGKDRVGIFDLETRILWHKPALDGAVQSISARDRGKSHTIPVSVRVGAFRHEVVFGLFDPTKNYGWFHFFQVDDESWEDPLPLEVVVDPTGGPWAPPH